MVFRDVTSCGFVDTYQYFGQTCCLDSHYSILEMAEAGPSKYWYLSHPGRW